MADGVLSRFERSTRLIRASWDVLRSDRELLVLPVLSVAASVLVIAAFGALMVASGTVADWRSGEPVQTGQLPYVWFFVCYLLQYFVVNFFNTALVGAALERLDGGDPTVGSALALASRRVGAIFGYAVVSATVGVLLSMLAQRLGGLVGRLLGISIGIAWTVMTFLVLPILATEGTGPIAAIEKSAALLRKTWGENLIGSVGISLAMSLITSVILIGGFVMGMAASQLGYPELMVPIVAGTAVLFVISALVGVALRAIYVAAVYYYAVAGEPPWGFEGDLLRSTFKPKGGI
jgi:Family of unknown function (DUF6159)